jgi:putative transposase
VWQRGFSEVRVEDRTSFLKHKEYMAQNPVRTGLSETPEAYPFCYAYLAMRKHAGAKAQSDLEAIGTAKAVP